MICIWLLGFFVAPQQVFAQRVSDRDLQRQQSAREYFFRESPDEFLMPVQVLGGVQLSGLYHVPKRTTLVRLIALAGGHTDEALLEEVVVRRQNKSSETIAVDLAELLRSTKNFPLEPNDVVWVPVRQPAISKNTVEVVSFTASLISVILSAVVLSEVNKD